MDFYVSKSANIRSNLTLNPTKIVKFMLFLHFYFAISIKFPIFGPFIGGCAR